MGEDAGWNEHHEDFLTCMEERRRYWEPWNYMNKLQEFPPNWDVNASKLWKPPKNDNDEDEEEGQSLEDEEVVTWSLLFHSVRLNNWNAFQALLELIPTENANDSDVDSEHGSKWDLSELRFQSRLNLKEHRNNRGANLLQLIAKRGSSFLGFAQSALDKVPVDEQRDFVNNENENGWTPLMAACRHDHVEMTQWLIEKGASLNSCSDRTGWTALHTACYHQSQNCVLLLLQQRCGADLMHKMACHVNIPPRGFLPATSGARTLLPEHVNLHRNPTIAMLIEYKKDGRLDHYLNDVLRKRNEIIHLLNEGKMINNWILAEEVLTFIEEGKEGVIDVFYDNITYRRIVPVDKRQPTYNLLFYCIFYENATIFHLLLRKGADVTLRNNKGTNVLQMLAKKGFIEWAEWCLKCIKSDRDKGKFINNMNHAGWTPLMSAAENDHPEMVKWLIDNGANVNAGMRSKWTALHSAALNGNFECLKLLLENGGDKSSNALNRRFGLDGNVAAAAEHAEQNKEDIMSLLKKFRSLQ